jgi:RimJ/RimL family protein N-acetyltransferase
VSSSNVLTREQAAYLDILVEQRCTRPEWWVREGDSHAALWSLPGGEVPSHIVLIETDWDAPEGGPALMARVHDLAASLGATALGHTLDEPSVPPQYQEHPEARVALLEASGYELVRDGLRWLRSGPVPPAPSALAFRTIDEVGDDAFADAIAATFDGTPDAELQLEVQQHGVRDAAVRYLADIRALEHRRDWWELGYTAEGDVAGVIMGARNPTSAVIGYVGVVPAQRGHGFATQLVRRGGERLAADEIRGDCDRDNVAMARAFARAGYQQFARRRSFRRDVPTR